LIATIKQVRPDLLKDIEVTSPPIPLDMPSHLQRPIEFVEDVGEPTTACLFTDSHIDPTGWFLSFFLFSLCDVNLTF
jgi:hypothetical protein